jgi:hypothetical protein
MESLTFTDGPTSSGACIRGDKADNPASTAQRETPLRQLTKAGSSRSTYSAASSAGLFRRRSRSVLGGRRTARLSRLRRNRLSLERRLAVAAAAAGSTGAGAATAAVSAGLRAAARVAGVTAGRGVVAAVPAGLMTGGRADVAAGSSSTGIHTRSGTRGSRCSTMRWSTMRWSTVADLVAVPGPPTVAGISIGFGHHQAGCQSSCAQHQSSHHGRHSSEMVLGL